MAYVTVEVDVDLYDVDTDDLREELERRGTESIDFVDARPLIQEMFDAHSLGKPIDEHLRQLYWNVLGRIL